MWFHYAHLKDVYVRVGQILDRGGAIGTLGTTGSSTAPHCHYEVHKQDPKIRGYNAYTYGLSREQVQAIYADPKNYRDANLPTRFDHLGYGYLSRTTDGTIHPGEDLNGPGQDLGQKVGVFNKQIVEYIQMGTKGFGNHVFTRELNQGVPMALLKDVKLKDVGEEVFNWFHDAINPTAYPGWTKEIYNKDGANAYREWITEYGGDTPFDKIINTAGETHKGLIAARRNCAETLIMYPKLQKELTQCLANSGGNCDVYVNKLNQIKGIVNS